MQIMILKWLHTQLFWCLGKKVCIAKNQTTNYLCTIPKFCFACTLLWRFHTHYSTLVSGGYYSKMCHVNNQSISRVEMSNYTYCPQHVIVNNVNSLYLHIWGKHILINNLSLLVGKQSLISTVIAYPRK